MQTAEPKSSENRGIFAAALLQGGKSRGVKVVNLRTTCKSNEWFAAANWGW